MSRWTLLLFAMGCTGTPTDTEDSAAEDCPDGEVFAENACLECGPAGGCEATGPTCRPACEACPNGYSELGCF